MTRPANEMLKRLRTGVLGVAVFGVALGLLSGCGQEEEPEPVPERAPPPPPPPPPPDPVTLSDVKRDVESRLGREVDARVHFAQEHAPTSAGLARAIYRFADALAREELDAIERSLSAESRAVFSMVRQEWTQKKQNIEAVRVVFMDPSAKSSEVQYASVGFAVQRPQGAELFMFMAEGSSGDWYLTALPSGDEVRSTAAAWDGAASFAMGMDLGIPEGIGFESDRDDSGSSRPSEESGETLPDSGGGGGGGGDPAGA